MLDQYVPEPVGFARLHGGVNDVYRIDLAGAENPLVLKIYSDEPAWILAKEALVAGWIGERVGLPIPRWLRVDERRSCIPLRFALTTWLPGATMRSLIGAPGIDAALSADGGTAEASTRYSHECLRLYRRRWHSAVPTDQR